MQNIRKITVIFIGLLLLTTSYQSFGRDRELESSLVEGNAHYKQGSYEQAKDSYLSILQEGKESASLYFNLANSYYKMGLVTKAIINYERAKLLDPKSEDIAYNLEIANQGIVDKITPLPKPMFVTFFENQIDNHSADGWGIRALVSISIVLMMVALFLFSSSTKRRRTSFTIGVITLLYFCLTFSFAIRQQTKIAQRSEAIITDGSVTVKGAPSSTSTELFIVHSGTKVKIIDRLSENSESSKSNEDLWFEIKLPDGNVGWIHNSSITII